MAKFYMMTMKPDEFEVIRFNDEIAVDVFVPPGVSEFPVVKVPTEENGRLNSFERLYGGWSEEQQTTITARVDDDGQSHAWVMSDDQAA